MQVATDYGWLGVGLVAVAVGALGWVLLSGLFLGSEERGADATADPIRAGVFAGAGATLVQSNFSFVFHLLPGAMVLGVIFGLTMISRGTSRPAVMPAPFLWGRRILGVSMIGFLVWFGWSASSVLKLVWPVIYGQPPMALEAPQRAMDRLNEAARQWPGFRLLELKGNLARELATASPAGSAAATEWNETAAEAYRAGAIEHPFHPGFAVNEANALSALGDEEAAEAAFERAIQLQGGLESAFRGRYMYALHLWQLWRERWVAERRPAEALWQFHRALKLLDEAEEGSSGGLIQQEITPLRTTISDAIRFLEGAGIRPREPDR